MITYHCDRCGSDVANTLGLQLVWAEGTRLPVSDAGQQRLVTLCANCRLDFDLFRENAPVMPRQP